MLAKEDYDEIVASNELSDRYPIRGPGPNTTACWTDTALGDDGFWLDSIACWRCSWAAKKSSGSCSTGSGTHSSSADDDSGALAIDQRIRHDGAREGRNEANARALREIISGAWTSQASMSPQTRMRPPPEGPRDPKRWRVRWRSPGLVASIDAGTDDPWPVHERVYGVSSYGLGDFCGWRNRSCGPGLHWASVVAGLWKLSPRPDRLAAATRERKRGFDNLRTARSAAVQRGDGRNDRVGSNCDICYDFPRMHERRVGVCTGSGSSRSSGLTRHADCSSIALCDGGAGSTSRLRGVATAAKSFWHFFDSFPAGATPSPDERHHSERRSPAGLLPSCRRAMATRECCCL